MKQRVRVNERELNVCIIKFKRIINYDSTVVQFSANILYGFLCIEIYLYDN